MNKIMTKEEYKQVLKSKMAELLVTDNKKNIAKKLKISRQTLYNYLREFEVDYKNLDKKSNYGLKDSGELEKRIDLILKK